MIIINQLYSNGHFGIIHELVFPLFMSNLKQLTVIKPGFRIRILSNKYDSLFSNA
jgi:hypothetical protein